MSAGSVTDTELSSWVAKSLSNNGLKSYEIKINGKSEKDDGYIGDIKFVSITGITNENERKTLHWVIKHSKKNDHLRSTVPVKSAFDTEIYFYNIILPTFKQFQVDKHIQDGFDSVPKCYNTFILDNMEVLLLDDLKQRGYELHNRKVSFNTCHLKAVLKEYGKLHALSFALKAQRTEDFNRLTEFIEDVYMQFLKADSTEKTLETFIKKALSILEEKNEIRLIEKLEKILMKGPNQILLNLMAENEPESVIIHGDCWNNNFMFKYQNADRSTPTKLAILDWQLSALRSPVFDLSFLIYATCSSLELEKFDELLKFYYTSFSNFLKELGSNPEIIFPFSSLKSHWKKYSIAGLLFNFLILPISLCDKEEAPALEDLKVGEKFSDILNIDIKDTDLYFERLKPVLNHYLEFSCE